MSDKSAIEWTDATWPLTYGCTKVSPGCAKCYIERTPPYRMNGLRFEKGTIPVALKPDRLEWPLRWKKPRRVFVCSLSDLFHDDVPEKFIAKAFAVMEIARQHTYQVLTKRPERAQRLLSSEDFQFHVGWFMSQAIREFGLADMECDSWPLSNVWLGVSVENQHFANERIPLLLQTPAAVRFLSCEPLLGPVDLDSPDADGLHVLGCGDPVCGCVPWIDWVIVGGESGPRHRPFEWDWARALRDQCVDAGVAFFVKQGGGFRPGNALEELPEDLRIREFPR